MSADVETWKVTTGDGVVTAVTDASPVAPALITEAGDRVQIQIWVDRGQVPQRLRSDLVRTALRHRAIRRDRTVLASVPFGDAQMLNEFRRHLGDVRTWVAGSTCLLEGRVR